MRADLEQCFGGKIVHAISNFCGLFAGLIAVLCAAPLAAAAPAPAFDAAVYQAVLAKAKSGDPTTDWTVLREQTLYQAHYVLGRWEQAQDAFKALDTDPAAALNMAESEIKANYTDLFSHVVAEKALNKLGRAIDAQAHHRIVVGLLKSITSGHDGLTQQTAFNAISVPEEYETLALIGLRFKGPQSVANAGGKSYDVMTSTEPSTGRTLAVWFNIDAYFGHLLDK